MASNRLNYGKVVAGAVYANGSNSFIRITGDYVIGSPTITNVVDGGQPVNFSEALVGQQLIQGTAFPAGTQIISIAGTTVTVNSNSAAAGTLAAGRISPPAGQYYISSGSLSIPNNSAFRYTNVTGSDDAIYKSNTNTYALILPLATAAAPANTLTGEFAQLKITKFGSRTNNVDASYYISASVDGINGLPDFGGTKSVMVSSNTTFAIAEQSFSQSITPIYSSGDIAISPGYALSPYGIAADSVFESFSTGSGIASGGSGSFSGSFEGDGSKLTRVTASKVTIDSLMLGTDSIELGTTSSNITGVGTITSLGTVTAPNFVGTSSYATKVGNSIAQGDTSITAFSYDGSTNATVAVNLNGTTLNIAASGLEVKNEGITPTQLSSSVTDALQGVFGGNGTAIGVQVDGNTIEIVGGNLQVKAGGLPTASLATSSFTLGTTVVGLGSTIPIVNKLQLTATTASGDFSGSFSGSFEGDGSGLTGVGANLNTAGGTGTGTVNLNTQTLTLEPGTGMATTATAQKVTISGVDATTSTRGIASFDSTNFAVTAGAVAFNNFLTIATASIGNTLLVSQDLTVGNDASVGRDLVVTRNLSVLGTASFQSQTNLDVADRFIRLASGSTSPGDGGIAIQQTAASDTELFAYDVNQKRWGFTSSFDPATAATFVPSAFVTTIADNNGVSASADFSKAGNMYVDTAGEIYIYS